MAKTATLNLRVDPESKAAAEDIRSIVTEGQEQGVGRPVVPRAQFDIHVLAHEQALDGVQLHKEVILAGPLAGALVVIVVAVGLLDLLGVADALEPGGSGDPYATLSEEEAAAVNE